MKCHSLLMRNSLRTRAARTDRMMSPTVFQRVLTVLSAFARIGDLSSANAISIGFEVGTVGRQICEGGACGLDGLEDAGGLVRRQVIHDHDISGIEGRRQRLLAIGKKSEAIHGAVEHHRRGHSGQPKRTGKGGCLPMPVEGARATALAPLGTPTQPRHLRRQARLVDEDQPGRIEVELAVKPGLALSQDLRPLLLQCVRGFFVREATPAQPVVQRAPANPDG